MTQRPPPSTRDAWRRPWPRIAQGLQRHRLPLAATVLSALGIAWLLDAWLDDRMQLAVRLGGDVVTFLLPRWFYALAALPLMFFFTRFSLTDLARPQVWLQAVLRSLTLAALILALARPTHSTRSNRRATVVLVDVSGSMSEPQLDAARRFVQAITTGPERRLEVVTFAATPEVAPRRDGSFVIERAQGARAEGTDIQAALQLANALVPDEYVLDVVIASDGNQTAGDLASEAYRAKSEGVKISWADVGADERREVRIAGMHVPDEVKAGQPFELRADLWSSHATEVTVSLAQDEFPNAREPSKRVALQPGNNPVKFATEAKRAGATTYRLQVTPTEGDTEPSNNTATLATPVKGRPRVLYVEGGRLADPSSASYFAKALGQENIDVEVRGPQSVPATAKELEPFDLMVLSDVPAHFVSVAQMAAMDAYVARLGGGLLLAGGQDSFGSGGYQGTKLEDISPVRFDGERQRAEPSIALVLVMDRSGSMEENGKLEVAKESAAATAGVLSRQDVIAVVAFDSQAQVYVRPQPAGNRSRIAAEIRALRPGGGTNIYPGLREAYELLQGINAKVKHVILLSDGVSPTDGIADLVRDMRAARITVSCVGVPGADKSILDPIASAGNGRIYMVEDMSSLPRIFMKETTEAQRSQLVEDLVSVRVAKRVEAIEGTGVDTAPPLRGYVSTKPKPTSEVVLVSDAGEPLLARWRHGAGNVVAWTSDVKNRWGAPWLRWQNYPKFWAQVIRTTMRRKTYDSYDLTATVADGLARVTVDAVDANEAYVNDLATTLTVIDPKTDKSLTTVPMQQTAAGRYVAEFRLQTYGSVLVKAIHQRDGKTVAESVGAVTLPYPPEYQRSAPNLDVLQSAAIITNGKARITNDQLFARDERSVAYTQELWGYLVLAAIVAFLLDLYAKRVRLFGYRTVGFDDGQRAAT